MKLKFTLFLLLFICSNCIIAQEVIRSIYNPFFKQLSNNEPAAALTEILKEVNPDNQVVIAAKIKAQFAKLDTADKLLRYEQLKTRNIGWHIAVHTYLLMYEKQPVLLSLTYYKKKKNWCVQDFFIRPAFTGEVMYAEQQQFLYPTAPPAPLQADLK